VLRGYHEFKEVYCLWLYFAWFKLGSTLVGSTEYDQLFYTTHGRKKQNKAIWLTSWMTLNQILLR